MHKMFIGGRWLDASDNETLPLIAPADGQEFARIARGREKGLLALAELSSTKTLVHYHGE